MNITQKRIAEELVSQFLIDFTTVFASPLSLPVPLEKIAGEFLGLKVDVESFKERSYDIDGLLIPAKRWILLNDTSNTRIRFTLAHEIAHWLIESGDINRADGKLDFSYFRNRDKANLEVNANYVAAALLMPFLVFYNGARDLLQIKRESSFAMARIFAVSTAAYGNRVRHLEELDEFGIVNEISNRFRDSMPAVFYTTQSTYKAQLDYRRTYVYVDNTHLDYSTLKEIRKIKKSSSGLHAIISQTNSNLIFSLSELDLFDSFVFLPPYFGRESESDYSDFANSNFVKLSNRKWFSKFVLSDKTESMDNAIFFRADAELSGLTYSQGTLFDVEKYLLPTIKVNSREDARKFIGLKKREGKRVVLVTGCFDIMSNGHAMFLEQAKTHGDILVVGIENDKRVRYLKGPLRPVNTAFQRIQLITALRCVDFTFVVTGSTDIELKTFYTNLHQFLKPNILAVYSGERLIDDRKEEIESAGGQLVVIPTIVDSTSTSSQILEILRENRAMKLVILSRDELRKELKNVSSTLINNEILVD